MNPLEKPADLVGFEMVHQVEAEHGVVPGAQVIRGRVPVAIPDPVRQAGRGDDLAADRRAARQVQHGRGQVRIAAAQLRRVPAMPASDVQHGSRIGGQLELPGHLGGAEPGEVKLAEDVPPPVRVPGRRVVVAGGPPAAGHLVQPGPPGPVVGGAGHEPADRQARVRVQPAPGGAAEPVPPGPAADVAAGPQAVQQQPGRHRVQAQVGGEVGGRARLPRQPRGQAGAHGGDERSRQGHPAPGLGGGSRYHAGPQGEPLGRVGAMQRKSHL